MEDAAARAVEGLLLDHVAVMPEHAVKTVMKQSVVQVLIQM